MEPISHIAVFYLIFRKLKIKKLWLGMLTSVLPDILLIISWIGIAIGLGLIFKSSHPLNLFLHSIFPLIILIPLFLINKLYFISATLGYSFHLFLDYLTHSTIRIPLYPFSTWKIPLFVTSYMNPIFSLSIHSLIIIGFLILDNERIKIFFEKLLAYSNKKKVWLLISIYFLIIIILSGWYSYYFLHINYPFTFIGTILISINLFLFSIIFLIEINEDERISKYLHKFKSLVKEKE